MLQQENHQGVKQAFALSSHFEELTRKQTDVQVKFEVLINQRAILLEQQREYLAMRKGFREQLQERKMLLENRLP